MSGTLVDITTTRPEHWIYVAEGGASLVVRYVGPPSATLSTRVLRVRKRPIAASVKSTTLSEGIEQEILHFQADIVSRILPPGSIPALHLALVDPPWLEELAAQTELMRPLARREVDCIDVSRPYAIVAPNLIGESGVTVEIKPKWGFLPNPVHLSPETRLLKTQTCRFCMHSYYRQLKNDKLHESHYCPLDLYSCDQVRVQAALRGLHDDWSASSGSANNLRFFLDGRLILPSDDLGIKHLRSHLAGNNDRSSLSEAFIKRLMPIVLSSNVLSSLSKVQRTLDELDIEGLTQLMRQFQDGDGKPLPEVKGLLKQPNIEEWSAFLTRYQRRLSEDLIWPEDLSVLTMDDARYHVLACLLSGTFKDCSLLIHVDQATLAVIDADPKLPKKLPGWAELDADIVEAYSELSSAQRKQCVDAHRPPSFRVPVALPSEDRRIRRGTSTFTFLLGITAMFILCSLLLPSFTVPGRMSRL